MINIKDLTGNALKKALGIKKCEKRWHNKNKSGGNFGINIYDLQGKNYEVTGYYNTIGEIYRIHFGFLYQAGRRIQADDFQSLIDQIKILSSYQENPRLNTKVA